jgi:rod shape-determining protein MreC
VVPTALYIMGGRDLLREGVSLAAKPFMEFFDWAADGISGFGKYFSSVDALIKENEELRAELEKYKSDAISGEIAEGENAWLRDQLGFVSSENELSLFDANIIGYSSSRYTSTFIINRGSESGIEKNMAVVAEGGVVGYVKEVSHGTAKVAGITDISSAVGVYCTRTGVYGVASGSETHILDGNLVIMGLSNKSDVKIGDVFCTSGYGGIYPKNIAVGRVVAIEKDEFMRNMSVVLEPCADKETVTRVFIVKEIKESDGSDIKG